MANQETALARIEPTQSRGGAITFAPRDYAEAVAFSKIAASTDMVPKDYQGKPEKIFLAIQMGAELGLAPMQSIQNIAVINGRPSLWGDAVLALVQGHSDYESIKEYFEGQGDARAAVCELKRRGHDLHTTRFSVADAKKAQLWGKQGPWTQYPERMQQMRARSWACRNLFADVLRGINVAEEAQDAPAQVVVSEPVVIPDAEKALREEADKLLTEMGFNQAKRTVWLDKNKGNLAEKVAEIRAASSPKEGTNATDAPTTSAVQTASAKAQPQRPTAADSTQAPTDAVVDPLTITAADVQATQPKPKPNSGGFLF